MIEEITETLTTETLSGDPDEVLSFGTNSKVISVLVSNMALMVAKI